MDRAAVENQAHWDTPQTGRLEGGCRQKGRSRERNTPAGNRKQQNQHWR